MYVCISELTVTFKVVKQVEKTCMRQCHCHVTCQACQLVFSCHFPFVSPSDGARGPRKSTARCFSIACEKRERCSASSTICHSPHQGRKHRTKWWARDQDCSTIAARSGCTAAIGLLAKSDTVQIIVKQRNSGEAPASVCDLVPEQASLTECQQTDH